MSAIEESMISCGVYQLYDLQADSARVIHSVVQESSYQGSDDGDGGLRLPAFYVFSDNFEDDEEGTELASYIKKHHLGAVVQSRKKTNPNTQNTIQVWVWSPNNRAIRKWARKNGWKTESYKGDWDSYPMTRWTHAKYNDRMY